MFDGLIIKPHIKASFVLISENKPELAIFVHSSVKAHACPVEPFKNSVVSIDTSNH